MCCCTAGARPLWAGCVWTSFWWMQQTQARRWGMWQRSSARTAGAHTAEEAAEAAGTIANELLCRIGPRVPRVYLR